MRYRNNYLDNVILRFEFPQINALLSTEKPELSETISANFPIVEGKRQDQIAVTVSDTGASINKSNLGWQWLCQNNEEGDKVFAIAPSFMSLEYKNQTFDYFPPYLGEFSEIFALFQDRYNVVEFTRLGLRYINVIRLDEGNPLEWNELINDNLLSGIGHNLDGDMNLARSMNQFIALKDDISLNFQYGIANPDYPNQVARKEFILDYDCVINGAIPSEEALARVDNLNDVAEHMFEKSISDGLRDLMEIINE